MFASPMLFLFLSSVILSIAIVCSSASIFLNWLALELNTLSFIPLLLSSNKTFNSENAIKYFLSQTLASIIFLMAISLPLETLNLKFLVDFLILFSMSIKLGAAPFHAWIPSMVESLPWMILFVLLTIQKINPLLILSSIQPSKIIFLLIVSSLIVGSLQGLIQTRIRKILTYSSISHLGWLLASSFVSTSLMNFYFILYSILLLPIALFFNKWNLQQLHQMSNLNMPSGLFILISLSILSLGGLPPFLGFFPKWIILQHLLSLNHYSICLIMILTSLITLYFYLRIFFSSFILSKSTWNTLPSKIKTNYNTVFLLMTNIMGLMWIFIF